MFRHHLPLNPEAFSPECRSCFLRRYVGRHYRLIIWILKHLLVSFASWHQFEPTELICIASIS
jgi:hypothetical protein